jgi:acyl-CoA synthetase (AMP-forming)/AMP-acid ligase II
MSEAPPPASGSVTERFSRSVISFRGDKSLSVDQLYHTAAAIRRMLETRSGRNWGVYVNSPFVQVASIIALQSLKRSTMLLPHAQPDFIEKIAPDFDGLLMDSPTAITNAIELPGLALLLEAGNSQTQKQMTDAWREPIGLLTSGSSGAPTQVFKSPAQIVSEVDMLEEKFGKLLSNGRGFHGTTSHQHLFGFTFRVMWPLLTGRAFSDVQIKFPGEVPRATAQHEQIVLISSPAFLSRACHLMDFAILAKSDLVAFSSGGPLGADTAVHFNRNTGISLVEIYGSTETGALASRVTTEYSNASWQPLPGVEVAIADRVLSSRAAHLPNGDWFETQDKAERSNDGGFTLLGRKDRIVKIADKRVSLTELERLLVALPEIEEARVFELDTDLLGAVLVPGESGWNRVREIGKDHFVRDVRGGLSNTLDRVTTPKRWRLVKSLPINAQGKIEQATLRGTFSNPEPGLDWRVLSADEEHWAGEIEVSEKLWVLDGHFPGNAIVPGVAQISWVVEAAKNAFDLDGFSGNLETVKFRSPIVPGNLIRLTLRIDRKARKVHFEMTNGNRSCSLGRLLLTPHG